MLKSEGEKGEVCVATESFANKTAVHGIPHIFQHSNVFAKCIWILICLCGSSKLILSISFQESFEILSHIPCRNFSNFCFIREVLQWWCEKNILKHTQMTNTSDTKIILYNYSLY